MGPLGKLLKDLVCVSPSQADDQIRTCYEHTMAEWLGCEAIVRQREKESHAAALAKCSSGASLDSHIQRMMHRDSTISNEVRLRGLREGCPHAGTWAPCQPVLQGETGTVLACPSLTSACLRALLLAVCTGGIEAFLSVLFHLLFQSV